MKSGTSTEEETHGDVPPVTNKVGTSDNKTEDQTTWSKDLSLVPRDGTSVFFVWQGNVVKGNVSEKYDRLEHWTVGDAHWDVGPGTPQHALPDAWMAIPKLPFV